MDFPIFIYVFDTTTKEYLTKLKIETLESYNKVKDLPNVTEVHPPEQLPGYNLVFVDGAWLHENSNP